VRTAHPFWNSSRGIDHIWTFGYDEGGCFAPAPLWPSMIISHWGNTMSKHNRCTTTYEDDRWDLMHDPFTRLPMASLIGSHPCYDPQKDLILPSFREMNTFLPATPEPPGHQRPKLFFFSGDLGSPRGMRNAGPHTSPKYSLGIRQAVWRAINRTSDPRAEVVGHIENDWWHVKYHAYMHGAIFCGAFPGDGWSGGISSAIFAGCVPVIVMDGIELPFENVLNYAAFSVRIAEADIDRLPAILKAIRPETVRQLQAGLARVRSRFGYSSLASNELRINLASPADTPDYLTKLAQGSERHEDALHTVLRVLLYRAAKRNGEVHA